MFEVITPFNLSIADFLVNKRQFIGYKVTVAKSHCSVLYLFVAY
jgi:hypothetical protein